MNKKIVVVICLLFIFITSCNNSYESCFNDCRTVNWNKYSYDSNCTYYKKYDNDQITERLTGLCEIRDYDRLDEYCFNECK